LSAVRRPQARSISFETRAPQAEMPTLREVGSVHAVNVGNDIPGGAHEKLPMAISHCSTAYHHM
jgi:hypothetical protein